jgi:hypothetical protein
MFKQLRIALGSMAVAVAAAGCGVPPETEATATSAAIAFERHRADTDPMPAISVSQAVDPIGLREIHVRLESPPTRPGTVCVIADGVVLARLAIHPDDWSREQVVSISVEGIEGAIGATWDDDEPHLPPGVRSPIGPASLAAVTPR